MNPVAVVAAARKRRDRVEFRACVGLIVAVVLVFCLTLSTGSFTVSAQDLFLSLTGQGVPRVDHVVLGLRLPRALVGLLVGLAFGVAGAVFQRLLRNPLASPDVIGITVGAGTAAVLAGVVFGASAAVLSFSALGGALATALLVYLLARHGGAPAYRLVLVGIGVGAVLGSITSFVLITADVRAAQEALVWLTGSLNGRDYTHVWPLLAAVVVLVPAALVLGRAMAALQLGDDLATGLGVSAQRRRIALLGVAVCLAGVATAAAGPVAFVAFVSGPIAARLTGGGRPALLAAGLVGALVVLVADYAGSHLPFGLSFPVGVVTAIVGGPYLLWLLASGNRSGGNR
ncbi:FecCD family ABC transporter permease [Lentzea sp. JNUCC 0626]|uniref:FecCD family ABC transporter permease n=1 Tax=Lentzea sp. JNUCC 0626 TaxID=3367513 RepID=UPI00374836B0